MADWTDPPWAQLTAGKPWTDEKAAAAFENAIAIAEGAPDAPKIAQKAFSAGPSGSAISFTNLDDYSGLRFEVSFSRNTTSQLTIQYSTDNGSTWSTPQNLTALAEAGRATAVGWFDFATGQFGYVGTSSDASGTTTGGNGTMAGASLAINAVRFVAASSIAATIYPRGAMA